MKRKEFIKNSVGLAGLSMMAPGVFASVSRKTKPGMQTSLKFSMVEGDMSVLDKFRMLKDIGFDGVEMDSPNDLNNEEIIAARDETGLKIPGVINSMHWKYPLSSPDPSVRKKCIASMKTALHDCKEYGGTTVLLVPGVVNKDIAYDDAYTRSQEEIRKLLPVAAETGVKIAIENVWNNFLISPLEAARYIDEFNHPKIGWYFDIGNIIRYGWPEQWIRILNKRILKMDAKEYSREKQMNEGTRKGFDVELMEGDNNWPAVLQAIEDIGYNGWASAEVPGGGRERLQKISDLMTKIFKS